MYKTESAAQAIRKCGILHLHLFRFQLLDSHLFRINSWLKIYVITQALSPSNAASLLENYPVILDCTNNAPTWYLLSDTAVSLANPSLAEQRRSIRASFAHITWGRMDCAIYVYF
jgi:molybdopterin/thiamine biosynthesis adenylyltransferase